MARRAHRVQEPALDVAGGEFSRVREEICAAPGGARRRRLPRRPRRPRRRRRNRGQPTGRRS